ncbi:MAG: T9SS type A sorting domain-containing protein [Ignavibacteria bacterium]|nr:T9SS type A sorting domain-containing protein [Ignavibacteria bacterium]
MVRPYLIVLILILDVTSAHAQWSMNPWRGTTITYVGGYGHQHILTKTSNGSVVIGWSQSSAVNRDVQAQCVDPKGVVLWKTNGVDVCVEAENQLIGAIVPDAVGGVTIYWSDYRSGEPDIYMQRLDKSGVPMLASNGIPVFESAANRTIVSAVSDGNGGTILLWNELENQRYALHTQRINSSGRNLWTQGGVDIYRGMQMYPLVFGVVSDNQGGLIFCWAEQMPNQDYAFYSQRVDSTGQVRWGSKGATICDLDVGFLVNSVGQRVLGMTSDGSSGAYFAFLDSRYRKPAIFLQHVDSAGMLSLEKNGKLISDTTKYSELSALTVSSTGQLFVAGYTRSYSENIYDLVLDLYGKDGTRVWAEPVKVQTDSIGFLGYYVVSDRNAGVIAFWLEGPYSDLRIRAQRFNSQSSPLWAEEGVFFASLQQIGPNYALRIISDGDHGAIVLYSDVRDLNGEGLYLKLINGDGELGVTKNLPPPIDSNSTEAPLLGITSISPNPTTGIADIEFIVPVKGTVSLVIYNAIGEIVLIQHKELVQRDVATSVSIDLTSQSSGTFYCRLTGPYIDETQMLILQK